MNPYDEQGFSNDSPIEIEEVNYIPMFCLKKYVQKAYNHPLKLLSPYKNVNHTVFINQQLQNKLSQQFDLSHQQGVVYRYGSKKISQNNCPVCFDSDFQGGNLEYVVDNGSNNYELYIKADTNTTTHFQWFYFKIRNNFTRTVTFTIKNFIKPHLLYQKGLKPYHRSAKKDPKHFQQIKGIIKYQESSNQETSIQLYELTFTYTFQFLNDEVEFCSQPPYSFSYLQKFIKNITMTKTQISKTVMGHKIQALIFNKNANNKAIVVAFARQHPGETVGSWMMEGFINQIKSSSSSVMWIIVPMINIDGVIVGNNRVGLLGYDFNRNWEVDEDPNRQYLFPQITGIMRYFKKYKKQFGKKVKLFIDFHGHSSQSNAFAFGPPHHKTSEYYDISKLFPFLISKKNSDFNFNQCSYQISQQKKNCARSIFFNKLGFPFSYTIESSFGIYRQRNINQTDMIRLGEDICLSAISFLQLTLEPNNKQSHSHLKLKQIIDKMKRETVETGGRENYESDSQEEDVQTPQMLQFQKKFQSILANKGSQCMINSFEDDKNIFKRKKLISADQRDGHIPRFDSLIKRPSLHNERMKTQQLRDFNNSTRVNRESSLYLPKLGAKRRIKQQHTSPLPSVIDCNLDNLSLQEVKERLFNLKHSKLGKRILIMNGHQNC